MKRLITLLLLLTVAPAAGEARSEQGIIGKKGYDFELKDIHGKTVKRSSFKGKVVVLDFWAVWCGPCQLTLPFLQGLADQYGAQGLEVVGLHVDDRVPPVEEVQAYLEARKVTYTNLLSTYEVDDAYMVYAMPTTYLLDRDGTVRKQHVGFDPLSTPKVLEREIVELLRSE